MFTTIIGPVRSRVRLAFAACLAVVVVCGHDPTPARAQGAIMASGRMAPSQRYFALFDLYYDGEYLDAFKEFRSELRGGIKNGPGNLWIDSICYHTMVGECHYQMGQFMEALTHYDAAVKLYAAFPDWMMRVQFDPAIRLANPGKIRPVPWGQSRRNARVGHFADTNLIGQGRINNNDVIRQGGVVQAPVLYPVSTQEIVRCTTLAMRRRRELMGPACAVDPLTADLIAEFARHPGPPNHWSEVYIKVQLGVAYAAQGKDIQAKTVLDQAEVAAGQFDHPLTATVLLELGHLALRAGDFDAAEKNFEEAGYAAVNFNDGAVLEESLRWGLQTHLAANRPDLYPPLETAPAWARQHRFRQLQASTLLSAAENYLSLGRTQEGAEALTAARAAMGRSDLANSRLGARMNYLAAVARYQEGNPDGGDQAFAAAMDFQTSGSLWMFHVGLADELWLKKGIPDRTAMALYAQVLREPNAWDWANDPLEVLSGLVAPQSVYYEHWFELALQRKEHEQALEISDRARRHRFLHQLELGGRVLNLRWVLEGPEEMLSQQAVLQRQDLLTRYPAYQELSLKARKVRTDLEQSPLEPSGPGPGQLLASRLAELARISQQQELILRQIALRREPCEMVFPPQRTTRQLQEALPEGHAALSYFATATGIYACLLDTTKGKEGYRWWMLGNLPRLQKQVKSLLHQWGNYEQNKELGLQELTGEGWKRTAEQIYNELTDGGKARLAGRFDEVVIIPDGFLWYVPFEGLQVPVADTTQSLLSQLRIRYAPTLGLAAGDPRPHSQGGHTAVVVGRLHPRDSADFSEAAFDDLARVVPGAVPLRAPLAGPSAVMASAVTRLVVLSDLAPAEAHAFDWSPVPLDRDADGNTLASWMALPWGGPEQILLPGFHTPAEAALKRGMNAPGADLFLSTCGLMACGARTVLISRWRTGGQTSVDLMREFTQELPHLAAADAWQRSVLLVSDTVVSPQDEPRLKLEANDEPPTAGHPFFWSGYLLADTGASAESAEKPKDPGDVAGKGGRDPARERVAEAANAAINRAAEENVGELGAIGDPNVEPPEEADAVEPKRQLKKKTPRRSPARGAKRDTGAAKRSPS